MVHTLKIEEQFYRRVLRGDKKAELRKNDRDFQAGDEIKFEVLNSEYEGDTYVITHVLKNYTGLEKGFCILSIEAV